MPITEPEWQSISSLVERVVMRLVGSKGQYFISGTVIKNDEKKKLVWLKEFGNQAIPVVGHRYKMKYYDETPKGTNAAAAGTASPHKTLTKTVIADVVVPPRGATVLVVREMGSDRLPRCLGEIQGTDWLIEEEE